jgi:hypothetical protein
MCVFLPDATLRENWICLAPPIGADTQPESAMPTQREALRYIKGLVFIPLSRLIFILEIHGLCLGPGDTPD